MLAFLRRNQIFFSSCFCLLLSLYILTAAARGQIKNEPVGTLLMWILRPLQIAGQGSANWIKGFRNHYDTLAGFRSENERLRKRLQTLEIERQRLLEAEATNRHLQQLLDFRSELPSGAITATIIASSASSWFQSCVISKGSADGVRKGMAVVTPLGVVGKVVAVTGRTAKVLLLTDPNSGIDVLVQRTRSRGIVSGSLESGTVLKYIKRSEDVQEGDRLVTSGLDSGFPKGLLVGTVIKVRKQNRGLFQSVEVWPAVQSARVEEVLVVGAQPDVAKK
ncbi:MAG TPA: rod shape-determining protein MreC [Candidatus Limnocylindrales bacterium]|nr:rod shape-determining protein MreC [Candidatus Limnocylindrales bacterium]